MIMGVAVVALGACSKTQSVSVLETKPATVHNYVEKVETVKEQVSFIPDWYLIHPKSEAAIYSTGTAASPDLQLSVDMAVLNAKTTLADRINGRVRSQTKSFIARIGSDVDASVLQEVEKATKNIIADVDVAGYNVDKTKVVVAGPNYRAFVLLEYSDEEATKVLMNRLRKDRILISKIRSTNAWKDLDNSVDIQHELDDNKAKNNIAIEKDLTSE